MKSRAIISIVAAISMLLHADIVGRHNFLMLTQAALAQALFDQGEICRGGSQSDSTESPLATHDPLGSAKPFCPVCLGLGPSLATLGDRVIPLLPPAIVIGTHRSALSSAQIPGLAVDIPPSRAPPSYV